MRGRLQQRCQTIITIQSDSLLEIKDKQIESCQDYNNGHHILTALRKAACEQKIDMGIREPINNFSTPLRIKFSLTKNIDIGLAVIQTQFPKNLIQDLRPPVVTMRPR